MSVLQITGGVPLRGELCIPGSKNAALAILSSVLLCQGEVVLHGVPRVTDVDIKLHLLQNFGAKVRWEEDALHIDCSEVRYWEPDEAHVRPIRTSFYLLGPLLARLGKARLPMPGGCKIGARPVDFHLKGLASLGAKIELVGGCYVAEVPSLEGAEIYLDFPSAGATQHLMATACLAKGVTTIHFAATEPEVVTLAGFLQAMGARIEGVGTATITVIGVDHLEGCNYYVPADRIQAGTYLLAGAITGGDVTVRNILPETQTALVNKLRESGAHSEEWADWVRVWVEERLHGIRVKTMPYPGFPTDIQQPMAALLALADGPSVVEETIYESRTGHIQELVRMGAKMRAEGRATVIDGTDSLRGAVVEASDLRAGAALVIAGLAAEGDTTVTNVHFIDRGYEDLEEHLRRLGGTIHRIPMSEWEGRPAVGREQYDS